MNAIAPRNDMPRNHRLAGFGLVLAIGLAACSGAGAASASSSSVDATSSATSTSTAAASPTATDTATTDPSAPATAAVSAKINANTATVEELQAAFAAAGISNADRWARAVAEYRPYPADPSWAQLRQELGKYNIDPAVLEQIIALLEV